MEAQGSPSITANLTQGKGETQMYIEYYTKDRYGAEDWWPVSKDAILVCELTRNKTLTDSTIRILEEYGATFKEILRPR